MRPKHLIAGPTILDLSNIPTPIGWTLLAVSICQTNRGITAVNDIVLGITTVSIVTKCKMNITGSFYCPQALDAITIEIKFERILMLP